jgi:hypothetical protein
MAFWYGLWSFGIFFTFWYVWTKKNLATLPRSGRAEKKIMGIISRPDAESIEFPFFNRATKSVIHKVARWHIFKP